MIQTIDYQLICKIKILNDQKSLVKLFYKYKPLAYRIFKNKVRNLLKAKHLDFYDFYQDCFLRFVRALENLDMSHILPNFTINKWVAYEWNSLAQEWRRVYLKKQNYKSIYSMNIDLSFVDDSYEKIEIKKELNKCTDIENYIIKCIFYDRVTIKQAFEENPFDIKSSMKFYQLVSKTYNKLRLILK